MRAPAFLLRSSPPSRGVFPQYRRLARRTPGILVIVSLVGIAGCATSGSGDMGTSLGGSGSQSTLSLTAPDSPTWSNDSGTTDSSSAAGSTTPVEQVTTVAVTAILPLASTLTSATQTLGATTGLGAPVSSVLTTLGSALGSEGGTLTQAGKGNALTSTLGSTVSALGTLTGSLAAVVTPAASSSGGSAPGGALENALAPVITAVGSLTASLSGAGTGSPLGALGSAGTTLGGLVGGGLSGVVPDTRH